MARKTPLVSIDATGTAKALMRELQCVRDAKSITKVNSGDPSAGGGLVQLVEAADPTVHSHMSLRQIMLDAIAELQ